ncbi:MAG: thermonuclease family protein, partial [Acholeplasmatales bacterium]|nr:thermonuclease family protein [Acholeplasmatales bacterium]
MKSFLKKLLLLVVAILCIAKLSSCGEESSGEQSKITKKLKLSAEYTGKDFYTQGIGQATLVRTSDGDTAAFTLVESNKYVTIRFFGIDTPESTGQVQKWGKAASIFTKDKLENAYEIVLEASTTPASVDSYGTRYLAYVWYKPTEDSDFLNLNLQLVENGYTKNNCINTSEYKYYEHFNNAEKAAKKNKLRIWNDDAEDPYFSTEAIITNIKDILENEETYYNAESDSGSKVRIEAYVVGFYKS